MDNVLVAVKPDDEVTYFTSDNVMQKKLVKELTYFNNKSGFFIEPGETAIVPVEQNKASHSLVVNTVGNAQKSLLLSYPQYVDGILEHVILKNHSRIRIVVLNDDHVAELIPLTKQRGVTK